MYKKYTFLHIKSVEFLQIFCFSFTKLFPKNDRKTFCSCIIMRLFRGADPAGGRSAFIKRTGRVRQGVWMMKKGESYA